MIKELESVASTNTWAKENAAQLLHGDVVVTHNQTSGAASAAAIGRPSRARTSLSRYISSLRRLLPTISS